MFMPKTGISVTLDEANLLWLRSRTLATKARSLSETLDELVTLVRTTGRTPAAAIRSVVGSVDIGTDDPALERADDYIRGLVDKSLKAPFIVRDKADDGPARHRSKRRG